ncbi:MAG: hypothetical protein JW940_14470 [Polyangiaceae bacterium]|nr:hypothetical protein [Polyangiaceae bacterium]
MDESRLSESADRSPGDAPGKFSFRADRDAWATIRGFVYQVDTTILRWLDLREGEAGEALELEAGEDIDRICAALANEGRQLEQVKHREAPLTLRSAECIEAISNFAEHRRNNPDVTLLFQFTTCAGVTAERPSPLRKPALELWQAVRRGVLGDDERREVLSGTLSIMREWVRPRGVSDESWNALLQELDEGGQNWLEQVIDAFDWVTSAPDSTDVQRDVRQRLVDTGRAPDSQAAVALHERLFFHVFRVLSERGRKRLTPGELVTVSTDTGAPAAHQLVTAIREARQALGARLQSLDTKTDEMLDGARAIAAAVGADWPRALAASSGPAEPPRLVATLIDRDETLASLLKRSEGARWVALIAGPGEGKTHLAHLLVRDRDAVWLRLRSLEGNQAAAKVRDSLRATLGPEWQVKLRQQVLVLDDLPRLSEQEVLCELLPVLIEVRGATPRLVTTSCFRVPDRFVDTFIEGAVVQLDCPRFTEGEAFELVRKYCPEADNRRAASFLCTLTGGHPLLLAAACRHLRGTGCAINAHNVGALFDGEHLNGVHEESTRQLQLTTTTNTRRLLYRLSLATATFPVSAIHALAAVDPAIEEARELIDDCVGVWVQREEREAFSVSPLIARIGETYLQPEERRQCHKALADSYLDGQVDQWTLLRAIGHYASARLNNRAANELWSYLVHVAHTEGATVLGVDFFVRAWEDGVPSDVSADTRTALRCAQVAVGLRYGVDVTRQLSDLEHIMDADQDQGDGWGVWIGAATVFRALFRDRPKLAATLLLRARRAQQNLIAKHGAVSPALSLPLSPFVGIVALDRLGDEHLAEWLRLVREFRTEITSTRLPGLSFEGTSSVLVDRLWLTEFTKPLEQQQWSHVLRRLEAVGSTAAELGLPQLHARATRAMVVVLAEHCGDRDRGMRLGRDALAALQGDADSEFLLEECLGRQHLYAGEARPALSLLSTALKRRCQFGDPAERLFALLAAARAALEANDPRMADFTREALELAKRDGGPDSQLVRTLGEVAVLYFRRGDLAAVYDACNEAVHSLLRHHSTANEWRPLVALTAHAVGYYAHLTATGSAPRGEQGGMPYAEPYPGLFYESVSGTEASPMTFGLLAAYMASFADALEKDEDAVAWARTSFDEAYREGPPIATQFIALQLPVLCASNARDALDVFRRELAGTLITLRRSGSTTPAEEAVLVLHTLPWLIRLLTEKIERRDSVAELGHEIAGLYRYVHTEASGDEVWNTIGSLVEAAVHGASVRELWVSIQPHRERLTGVVEQAWAVIAMLPDGASLEQAVHNQMSLFPGLGFMPGIVYRRIFVPFVDRYWSNAFAGKAWMFRTPRLVEQGLARAASLGTVDRLRETLVTVATGLGVDVPPHVWNLGAPGSQALRGGRV